MEKLRDILVDNNSLLDTRLKGVNIYLEDNELNIKLSFDNFRRNSDFKTLDLVFEGVIEYSFYYSDNYYFYNIETFKFFQEDNEVYISLDPNQEIEGISDDDQDFVRAKNVSWTSVDSSSN